MKVIGRDLSGTGTFRGDSPHGASLFAIFSARQTGPQQQEQVHQPKDNQVNLILIAAILIIVIIALAIIILLFAQRRKKKA
jgi:heme/copper-type cytochrome/quinol oxidase subunit 2